MRSRRAQRLRGGRGSWSENSGGVDPNSSLTNLSDCMLVLALGLMLALVVAWNAEIPNMDEVEVSSDMTEIENIEALSEEETMSGEGYIDMGTVWQDPNTGKFYMINKSESSSSSGGSSESSESGDSSESGSGLTTSQTSPDSLPQSGSSQSDGDGDGE